MATMKTGPSGVACEPAATGFTITGGTTTQTAFTVPINITSIENVAATMTDVDDRLSSNAAVIDKMESLIAEGTLTWSTKTTTPVTCAVQNGYVAALAAGGPLVFNLPATAAIGDEIHIIGQGPELFTVVPDASDFIRFNNLITKAGGAVLAIAANDCITVRCAVANSVWEVVACGGAFSVTIS